jgi:hypothetical protein
MSRNIIIGLLALVIIIGGVFYFSQNNANNVSNTTVTTTQNPVSTTPSTPAVTSPNPGVPVVVSGPSTAVSSSTAVVSGSVKPNGALTTYWYEYGETTALGTRTSAQQIGSGFTLTPTPAFITGLRASTVYYFRLSANNRFGTVTGSTITFQTNNTPAPTAALPTVRTDNAGNVNNTTANLNGAVNPNGWPTSFWFEFGKDANLGNVTSFQSAGNSNSLTSVTLPLSGLQPSTRYFFRINAQNQFGTVNGQTLNFTTSGPVQSASPTVNTTAASNITTTGARLNGQINPNGVETNYWFEYSLSSTLATLLNPGASIQTLSAGTANVDVLQNVTGLLRNTTYFYRLVGRNSSGTVNGGITSFKTSR